MKHLLKHEYSKLTNSEYKKLLSFLEGRCSQYYFLDYMRCSNGDVNDAIHFFELDESLRNLLMKYFILYEIQLKSDFVDIIESTTHSSSFWKHKKFYIKEALLPGPNKRPSKYYRIKSKIKSSLNRLKFQTIGPLNHAVLYTSSYGTFEELFKLIDPKYKKDFIGKYSTPFLEADYKLLISFLEGIRRIRNRCAHGSHIISIKMVNDLNSLRKTILNIKQRKIKFSNLSLLDSIVLFVCETSYYGEKLLKEYRLLYENYSSILDQHYGKHSLSRKFPCELY